MEQLSRNLLTLEQQIIKKLVIHFSILSVLVVLVVVVTIQITLIYRTNFQFNSLKDNFLDHLVNIGSQEGALINQQLVGVRNQLKVLGPQHQNYLNFPQSKFLPLPSGGDLFAFNNEGALYKKHDNGGASLYYTGAAAFRERGLRKATNSEFLDETYRVFIENNKIVSHIFFYSWDNMFRIYPFVPDMNFFLDVKAPIKENTFYSLVIKKNNASNNVVWIPAYQKSPSSGGVISAILPIYTGSFLEGVAGLNLNIKELLKSSIERSKVENYQVMLLDSQNNVISASEAVSNLFNLVMPEQNVKGSRLQRNSQLSYDKSTNVKLLQWLSSSRNVLELDNSKGSFLITSSEISETKWKIVLIQNIPKADNFADFFQNPEFFLSAKNVFLLIALCFFYMVIVFKKAHSFSENVIQPIRMLENWLSFSASERQSLVVESKVLEIQRVLDRLQIVAKEFIDNKKNLKQAQISKLLLQKKVHLYHEMAITDPLTGLKNRKYMESVLKFQNLRGFGDACCFLMLDIDHFKRINDCHGHSTGDLVLQKVANTLSSLLRTMDVIVRWGGEEFLLFCPDTSLGAALALAERLRFQIETLEILPDQSATISIGIAQMKKNERAEETIERADLMLYRSKNSGRNRVTVDNSSNN